MKKEEIFETVKKIIADELQADASNIKLESSLEADLGADSLDAIELVCALEENFNVSISDEDAMELKTVSQIVDYIEAHQ